MDRRSLFVAAIVVAGIAAWCSDVHAAGAKPAAATATTAGAQA